MKMDFCKKYFLMSRYLLVIPLLLIFPQISYAAESSAPARSYIAQLLLTVGFHNLITAFLVASGVGCIAFGLIQLLKARKLKKANSPFRKPAVMSTIGMLLGTFFLLFSVVDTGPTASYIMDPCGRGRVGYAACDPSYRAGMLSFARKAAPEGDAQAQYTLGNFYADGRSKNCMCACSCGGELDQDFVEAYFWLSLAANAGNKDAVDRRAGIEVRLSQEQKVSVDKRVQEWKPMSAAKTQACKSPDDCKDFCKGAGKGKECLPDGVPLCSEGLCSCALTCR